MLALLGACPDGRVWVKLSDVRDTSNQWALINLFLADAGSGFATQQTSLGMAGVIGPLNPKPSII